MRLLSIVAPFSIVFLCAFAFAVGGGGEGDAGAGEPPPPPASTVFAGVLLRVGLGADALAAAGITSAQVPSLVAAVEQNYDAATLASRDQAYIDARQGH